MASNEEPVLSDELILEFEQRIKDEEAEKVMRSLKTSDLFNTA